MTPEELTSFVNFKLQISNTTDFTEMLLVTNTKLLDICEKINEANPTIFGNVSEEDLLADTREYDLPKDKIGTLKAVFLKLNGTDLKRAKWLDFNHPIFTDVIGQDPLNLVDKIAQGVVYQEDWITSRFSNDNPYVFVYRDSLFILSDTITAVTDGIQLWYSNFPDPLPNLTEASVDLATATDNASSVKQGLPKQFHELLARAVMIEYKSAKGLPLTGREAIFDQDLEEKLDNIRDPNFDQSVIGALPFNDGSDL